MTRKLFLIAGVLNLLLGLFHLFFWKLFNWPQDLMSISHDNRAILQIANIHLTMLIVFFGYVSIVHWKDLFTYKIGKAVSFFMAVFYFIRIINEAVFWTIQSWESLVTALICGYFIVVYTLPTLKKRLPMPVD
jgi:hypothetical protein